jgi:hypothetical protein
MRSERRRSISSVPSKTIEKMTKIVAAARMVGLITYEYTYEEMKIILDGEFFIGRSA